MRIALALVGCYEHLQVPPSACTMVWRAALWVDLHACVHVRVSVLGPALHPVCNSRCPVLACNGIARLMAMSEVAYYYTSPGVHEWQVGKCLGSCVRRLGV